MDAIIAQYCDDGHVVEQEIAFIKKASLESRKVADNETALIEIQKYFDSLVQEHVIQLQTINSHYVLSEHERNAILAHQQAQLHRVAGELRIQRKLYEKAVPQRIRCSDSSDVVILTASLGEDEDFEYEPSGIYHAEEIEEHFNKSMASKTISCRGGSPSHMTRRNYRIRKQQQLPIMPRVHDVRMQPDQMIKWHHTMESWRLEAIGINAKPHYAVTSMAKSLVGLIEFDTYFSSLPNICCRSMIIYSHLMPCLIHLFRNAVIDHKCLPLSLLTR